MNTVTATPSGKLPSSPQRHCIRPHRQHLCLGKVSFINSLYLTICSLFVLSTLLSDSPLWLPGLSQANIFLLNSDMTSALSISAPVLLYKCIRISPTKFVFTEYHKLILLYRLPLLSLFDNRRTVPVDVDFVIASLTSQTDSRQNNPHLLKAQFIIPSTNELPMNAEF